MSGRDMSAFIGHVVMAMRFVADFIDGGNMYRCAKFADIEGHELHGFASQNGRACKVGDGQPWTPTVTVKGGTSGFYTIKVGK